MKQYSTERYLIHGPLLTDLTDLLYYDALIYPITQSTFPKVDGDREINLIDASGKPVLIAKEVEEKLVDAKLIIRQESILDDKTLAQFNREYAYIPSFPTDARKMNELYHAAIHWIQSEDKIIRGFANLTQERNINAVPKFLSTNFSKAFPNGKNEVLGIIYSQLPILDKFTLNINELIDFLSDEETKVKRGRLFSWQNDIRLYPK